MRHNAKTLNLGLPKGFHICENFCPPNFLRIQNQDERGAIFKYANALYNSNQQSRSFLRHGNRNLANDERSSPLMEGVKKIRGAKKWNDITRKM